MMNDNPNMILLRMAEREAQITEAKLAGIKATDINAHEWDGLVSVAGGHLFITDKGLAALSEN